MGIFRGFCLKKLASVIQCRRLLGFLIFSIIAIGVTIGLIYQWYEKNRTLWLCPVSMTEIMTSYHSKLGYVPATPLIIWNTDSHPAPAADIREFVEPLGARILQYDFSGYCHLFGVCDCRQKLKVLSGNNYESVDASQVKSEFYAAYKDDPVMQTVDAFLCTDVIAICQLYMQFNKTIIIVATNRYYVRRIDTVDRNNPTPHWHQWNADLKTMASDPRNVIAANNMYDVNFMRYFTGIEPSYIPTFAGYTDVSYNPTKSTYLIARNRLSVLEGGLLENCTRAINRHKDGDCKAKLEHMAGWQWHSNVASYLGIVHIPYQVSTISLFEQYRMNIPLFFPSKQLLISWDIEHWLLRERTQPPRARSPRALPPHESQKHLPNPNDEYNATAMDYWLQFADYYTLPHIQYFDSVEHLVEMMCRLTVEDLHGISRQMQKHNLKEKVQLMEQWEQIMQRVAKNRQGRK